MKKILLVVILSMASLQADVFLKGDKQIGVTLGAGSGYGSNYTIFGVGGYYFPIDGLSVGLGYRGWFGSDPGINELTLPVTYYIPLHHKFRPYAGALYRRTFVDSPFKDYNTFGARAGVAMILSPNSYISVGWVQEYYDTCDDDDCSNGYPEFAVGFSF